MKLKKDFITHDTGTESMLVPTGKAAFSGLVRGNRTFGAIVELLKQDTSEAEVIAAMKARYDAPEEIIARDVRKILTELREIGAIEE
ncbi:MAG: PqqD family protein [Lachnospiraceae bacterium]|nr:PqqD family protein [Lachnospiraceae bacterium]